MPETTDTCKNCGTSLKGEYCHHCGQSSKVVKRPARELLSDIFNHLFQWDNRLFTTLKMLFLKPGQLSLEWSEGKRARQVPPFRLYLIASFVVFLVFGMASQFSGQTIQTTGTDSARASEVLTNAIDEARSNGHLITATILGGIKEALKDPAAYFQKIKANLPKTAILLLPVFGLLHSLAEIRRGRYLIEYLVFSLHLHAFAFSIVAIILLLGILSKSLGDMAQVLYLALPVYACVGIRRFNPQSWWKSIFKTGIIMTAYLMILGIITAGFFTLFLFV